MVGLRRSGLLVRSCSILALLGVLLNGGHALAQGDAATAEVLFQQGRDLLRAGKASEACPKLEESQRLDPATGTLLALAMCHDAEGKLASAWAEFVSVEARARNEGRKDREKVARTRAQALKGRLSTLEIRVPAEVATLPDLEIRRDGIELGRGAWNVAVPIDGGEHRIEVKARGRSDWQGTVSVKNESDAVVLQVPALEEALPEPAALDRRSPALDAGPPPTSSPRGWSALEWTGIGVAGAGAISLAVGGYFLSEALGKKSESETDCSGNFCGPRGFEEREDAVSRGNTATILGIAGGALLAGGATLVVIGRINAKAGRDAGAASPPVTLAVGGSQGGFAARFSSTF